MTEIEDIMKKLDNFVHCPVARRDNGKIVPSFYIGEPSSELSQTADYDYRIQQVREEIKSLVEVLLNHQERNIAVEIGLGNHGGTHYLWKMLFDKVITIEGQQILVDSLDYEINPNKDKFIVSASPEGMGKLSDLLEGQKCDFLFIDADHSYKGVKDDYQNYIAFVKDSGIICFHDSCNQQMGVKRFVDELRQSCEVFDIICDGNQFGISYIVKK